MLSSALAPGTRCPAVSFHTRGPRAPRVPSCSGRAGKSGFDRQRCSLEKKTTQLQPCEACRAPPPAPHTHATTTR